MVQTNSVETLAGAIGRTERSRAMWQMSDFEAAVFMLAVALMVALFTTVTW